MENDFQDFSLELYDLKLRIDALENLLKEHLKVGDFCPHTGK